MKTTGIPVAFFHGLYSAGLSFFLTTLLFFGVGNHILHAQLHDLYGVTPEGGADNFGTVIKVAANGGGLTKVYDFLKTPGGNPYDARLMQAANGKLYGTAGYGGTNDDGVLFEYDPATGAYAVLYHFDYPTGATPQGRLLEWSGKLYGLTRYGGPGDGGVLFEYDRNTQTYTVLRHFEQFIGYDPHAPVGSLVEWNGLFYGVATNGGTQGGGALFSFDPLSQAFSILYEFSSLPGSANGYWPQGSLTLLNNKLYGTAERGGDPNEYGVLFEYDPGTNTYQTLHTFDQTNGAAPQHELAAHNGILYGTTNQGGNNGAGVLYAYDPVTDAQTVLHHFDYSWTGHGPSGLSVHGDVLYGSARFGGNSNNGVLYAYDINTSSLQVVLEMGSANINARYPMGGLFEAGGRYFGLTEDAVYEYQGNQWFGIYIPLVRFLQPGNGQGARGRLLDVGGKLFGLTNSGGLYDRGVLFELDPLTGIQTVRHAFDGNTGAQPGVGLTEAGGKLYGLTESGSYPPGGLFEFDPATNSLQARNFNYLTEGGYSRGALTNLNGKLYGATQSGGPGSRGALFEYDPATTALTVKHVFNGTNGSGSGTPIVAGGKLYGLCYNGGTHNQGVLYAYDPAANQYQILHHLQLNGGAYPDGELTYFNGKLYGLAPASTGTNTYGVLFSYDLQTAQYTVHHWFNGAQGAYPNGSLCLLGGKLYGLTLYGGAADWGVAFEYNPAANTYTVLGELDGSNGGRPSYAQLIVLDPLDTDADGDGYTEATGDCNDQHTSAKPGATEACGNNVDDDCDGQIDENCISCAVPWTQMGPDFDGVGAFDQSGSSVSLSADGTRLAISTPSSSPGRVQVYQWNGSTWTLIGSPITGTGYSVSLSADGNTVAVGGGSNNGLVRIFTWDGSAWTQMGSTINAEAAGDNAGFAVSVSGNGQRVAMGALGNDGNGLNAGHVRVFEWNGVAWVQLGVDIDGEAAGDRSGTSVSISTDGNRVAIGAPFNFGDAPSAGHVRVYEWNGATWTQLGADINGEAEADRSGSSVALSADGSRVAIGAVRNDGNGTTSGHVRVYSWNGSAWVQTGSDLDGEGVGNQAGYAVALSQDGNTVAVGANLNNNANGSGAGHVRVYQWTGSAWWQVGFDLDGEAAGDNSGHSVALSADGTRVAIGAPYNNAGNSAAGQTRVYEWCMPEMELSGNNNTIADGDNTPDAADHTNFGSLQVNGQQVVRTFTINNSGVGNLTVTGISLFGPGAAHFSVQSLNYPVNVAGGAHQDFDITFDPSAVGAHTATVTIANTDDDENPYTFDIQGEGEACAAPLPTGTVYRWTNNGGDGLWNNPNNWLNPSNNPGVPGAGHTAFFACYGLADATLNVNTTIAKIVLDASYPGTLHLGSQTLTLSQELTVADAGQLDAGTSTVVLGTGSGVNLTVDCPAGLHHLTIHCNTLYLQQHLHVSGDLLLNAVNSLQRSAAGAADIKVAGNLTNLDANAWNEGSYPVFVSLTGGGDQTLGGAGAYSNLNIVKPGGNARMLNTLTVSRQLKGDAAANLVNAGGILRLGMGSGALVVSYAGTVESVQVHCNTFSLLQDLHISDDLEVVAVGSMSSNGGAILWVAGDLVIQDIGGWSGNTFIGLEGATDQSVSGPGQIRSLHVNKTGGAVLMPDNLDLQHTGQLSGAGFFDNTGGVFNTMGSATFDFSGAIEDLRLTTSGGNRTVTLIQDVLVTNTLTLAGAGAGFRMTASPAGKKLKVNGNVSTEVFSWNSGTNAFISLTGAADQTITTVGSGSLIRLNVAKTGGNVLLPADVWLFTNGELTGTGILDNTGGVLRTLGSATFDFAGTVEDLRLATNGVMTTLKQDLQVTGALILDATASGNFTLTAKPAGKVLKVNGNVTTAVTNWNTLTTSAIISLRGTADQTIDGAGSLHRFDFAKPSGNALFNTASVKTFSGAASVTAGNWDLLGNTFTSSTGGFTASGTGKLTGAGTLTGNVTVNTGGGIAPGGPVGCMTITGNLSFQAGASYAVDVNAAAPACTGFDQLTVSGNVAYAGALSANFGYTPSVGATYLIANVTGTKSGNFTALTVTPANIACTFAPATGILTVTGVTPLQAPGDERSEEIARDPRNPDVETSALRLHVYPNPASEWVTLEMAGPATDLLIYDQTGRLLWQVQPAGLPGEVLLRINLNDAALPGGVYQIVLRSADNVVTKRLVVIGQ